jgi:hypothetical protein
MNERIFSLVSFVVVVVGLVTPALVSTLVYTYFFDRDMG